jgi:photosystem II stability/assembly factor-like uncharacterized protein
MGLDVFLATTGHGVAAASRDPVGAWSVVHTLEDQAVRCLAADPVQAGIVYAGTNGAGVLRSGDAGRTWQPAGLAGQTIRALAASRVAPGTVYAGTKPPCLFVSHDGGASWTELDGFRWIPFRWLWRSPAERPFTAYVQAIALSPTDPDILVVGIEAGATVRSTDCGRTWSRHLRGSLRDCHSLTFHATDGDWVYEAGGTGGGASVSRDGGRTWTRQRTGLDRHYGWACAADPARPEVWYVSASPGPGKAHGDGDAQAAIFRSMDGRWQRLEGGLPQPLDHMPYGLLTDPEAPGHLYAGLANGRVWHSTNHGDHWVQLPFELGAVRMTLLRL